MGSLGAWLSIPCFLRRLERRWTRFSRQRGLGTWRTEPKILSTRALPLPATVRQSL